MVVRQRSKGMRRSRPSGPRLRELTISSVGFSYAEVNVNLSAARRASPFLPMTRPPALGVLRENVSRSWGLASLMRCAERTTKKTSEHHCPLVYTMRERLTHDPESVQRRGLRNADFGLRIGEKNAAALS